MLAVPAGNLTHMVGEYVSEKTGMVLQPGMYSAFMVVDDDKNFVAGVTITNFRKTDCEVSCASDAPLAFRPHVCRAIFKYIFEQLGCVRCTSITVKGNRKARSFLEGLGFQLEGNVRLGYDGRRDALIYGLLRSECRFLADGGMTDEQEGRPYGTGGTGPGGDSGGAREDEHRERDGAGEPQPH